MARAHVFRLDPFAADYDAAIQLTEAEEPKAPVDLTVEHPVFDTVRPAPGTEPARVFLVDGVRRVEHRLRVETDEGSLFGLLGSYGVGAVCLDRAGARVSHGVVGRLCVVGGGALWPGLSAPVPEGRSILSFEPRLVSENTPEAPLAGLQTAMREGEARLVEDLGPQAEMVVLDGPLTFLGSTSTSVVGLSKTLLRAYLPPREGAVLRRLEVGERTPLFLIQDARAPRYSWYQRLARGRSIESALTGVVRLEASAALGLARARALADTATRLFPKLASDSAHDPRAPNNLIPVGGLEQRLRRLLGDPHLIRRAIEACLFREASA